jgi:hypothetical protein
MQVSPAAHWTFDMLWFESKAKDPATYTPKSLGLPTPKSPFVKLLNFLIHAARQNAFLAF